MMSLKTALNMPRTILRAKRPRQGAIYFQILRSVCSARSATRGSESLKEAGELTDMDGDINRRIDFHTTYKCQLPVIAG